MATAKLTSTLDGAVQLAAANAARLQRLTQPPPAGYPAGPPGDQAVALLRGPLEFLETTSREYGPVAGLLLGGERVILVTGAEAAQQVMVAQADVFVKRGTAFFPGSSLAGEGLLVSDGDVWQRQRRLSNPAFRRAAVDTYAAAMVTSTQRMLDSQWRPGSVRDVYADFNSLTLGITLEALFGASLDNDDARREAVLGAVATAFSFFARRASAGMLLPEWLPTWDNLEFGAAVARLDKLVYDIIAERRQRLAAGAAGSSSSTAVAGPSGDLLQALLAAVDEQDGRGMSDVALRDELMTLLVAGQETSAILLGWACALFAHHPAAQAVAADEVRHVLGGRPPCAADARRLPRLTACVLEALRLHAPAYLVGRCAARDTTLAGGHAVAAGTTVLISPYIMHRDAAAWGADAAEFRPVRWAEWLDGAGPAGFMALLSGLGPNGTYLPFGAGPRNCIGTGFAMMEAILVLATVLQKYQLQPAPGAAGAFPAPVPLITLRPEAVRVQLLAREGAGRFVEDDHGTEHVQHAQGRHGPGGD